MEACEEVADTFSDVGGCAADYFTTRLGSLNLTCTSHSFDPAFTFDTSSRSSSLRHCDSTSRSGGSVAHPQAPTLLAAVSPLPCTASRRHVAVLRRSSLPSGTCDPHTRLGSSDCTSRQPALPERPAAAVASAAGGASASTSCAGSCLDAPTPYAGMKRRSCPEPLGSPQRLDEEHERPPSRGDATAPCSEAAPTTAPQSPATSFASFAAALAAHYYADFGSVPDVPTHIEEVRIRATKRQRVLVAGQTSDV